jgi:hypothetical protein
VKRAAIKPLVPYSALEALDIRVGTIVSVQDVPKSRKLVRLIVDFGDHQRSIIAGIKAERSNPSLHYSRMSEFLIMPSSPECLRRRWWWLIDAGGDVRACRLVLRDWVPD